MSSLSSALPVDFGLDDFDFERDDGSTPCPYRASIASVQSVSSGSGNDVSTSTASAMSLASRSTPWPIEARSKSACDTERSSSAVDVREVFLPEPRNQ